MKNIIFTGFIIGLITLGFMKAHPMQPASKNLYNKNMSNMRVLW